MKNAFRSLALASTAALVVAACSNEVPTAPSSPTFSQKLPSSDIGVASAAELQVCVSGTSPGTATYTLNASNVSGLYGNETLNTGASQTITPGNCIVVIQKQAENDIPLGSFIYPAATAVPVISANVAGTWTYSCVSQEPTFCVSGASGSGNTATVKLNFFHGTTLTYDFQATPQTAPVPLFVIGDVEPHGIGTTVNFWGSQWWKNNFMSGFVANGVASFKGYATDAQNVCGGTWVARPGNSGNPPNTIPSQIAIIVTPTVNKQGPNISGTISQILIVDVQPGYSGNPGHWGNGVVTSVACSVQQGGV